MTCRALVQSILALSIAILPSLAHAQDLGPVPPPLPPPPIVYAPAVQAAVVVGEHTCIVGEHAGIDDADARTTTDLVCGELAPLHAPAGIYDVRFGKLGSRVLLGVGERATGSTRRVLVQSFDEVPLAAHRLVAALVEHKSVEETQNVDNVVASESRKSTTKSLATNVDVALVGVTAVGVAPNASAGIAVGLMFRSARWSMGSHFRGGGAGTSNNKLGFASVDVGVRHHFGDGDTATFVGGGVALSYLIVNRDPVRVPSGPYASYYDGNRVDFSPDGSGFGAYVEAGVEILRSSRAGAGVSLRADVPFYVLKNATTFDYGAGASGMSVQRYVVPISLNLGFSFH